MSTFWFKKYIFNTGFALILAEAALPLLVTYAMFIVSEEGIKLYDTMIRQIKGVAVDKPLGYSGWIIVLGLPVAGILWTLVIFKRYTQEINREDNSKLRNRIDFYSSNFMTLVHGLLYSFADELELDNSDRVTVYVRVASNSVPGTYEFQPVSRYAGSPAYRSKGRTSYPSSQGVINKAWQNGAHFDNQAPSPATKSGSAHADYHEKTYGIKKHVTNSMRMKSRLYYGWRVKDSSGKEDIAVIILESTNKARFTKVELEKFFGSKKRFPREFVTNIQPLLPSGIAGASGF